MSRHAPLTMTPDREAWIREHGVGVTPQSWQPGVTMLRDLLAEVDALRAESLHYYSADGTFVVMESREDVVVARVAAAQRIGELERELERWSKRLDFFHTEFGADGSGCDSGDPLDVIESEARGVITRLTDELAERTKQRDEVGALAAEQGVLASQRGIQVNALREALRETNALMVRLAHVFSCGAYDKLSIGGVCGECTCGVDAAANRNEELLAATPAASLETHDAEVIEPFIPLLHALNDLDGLWQDEQMPDDDYVADVLITYRALAEQELKP